MITYVTENEYILKEGNSYLEVSEASICQSSKCNVFIKNINTLANPLLYWEQWVCRVYIIFLIWSQNIDSLYSLDLPHTEKAFIEPWKAAYIANRYVILISRKKSLALGLMSLQDHFKPCQSSMYANQSMVNYLVTHKKATWFASPVDQAGSGSEVFCEKH